jgi:hypothetical protein
MFFLTLMVGDPRSPSAPARGARHRCFLALIVDALGSPALTPPRGPPSMFLSVDGGRSRISGSRTSQGVRRRRFLR